MTNVAYSQPPEADFEIDDDADEVFDLPEDPAEEVESEAEDEIELCAVATLRDYQKQMVESVLRQFGKEKVQSTLVVAATGTGKSIAIAELARRTNNWGHGVLILVHRDELVRQLLRSLARLGVAGLKEKASERALPLYGMHTPGGKPLQTVVASVQTLRGDRLKAWPQDAFRLIITDEAHHACAVSYKTIYDHFEAARHVGFTATADRLDKKNVGAVFESLAFEYNLRDAVRDGWLVPVQAFPVTTDPPIDLRDLRITAGDFNTADLEQTIQDNIGTLVNALAQTNALEDRRTIAFTPDIGSAKSLALALNHVGISAAYVSGKCRDRSEKFEAHQAGRFQVLVNCMLATEGYDDPQVSCILMCRPTKSRSLYSQMVGRGTRPYPGPQEANEKPNCRVVDFAYLTGRHQLVSPVELYDNSQTPDKVVSRARELMQTGQEPLLDKALEKAQAEFEQAEVIRIQRRRVNARTGCYDLIAANDILGVRHKENYSDWMQVKPATPAMIQALRNFKVDVPDDLPFASAKQLLDCCITRAKYKLATIKQVNMCIRLGCPPGEARRLSFEQASAYITANKNW